MYSKTCPIPVKNVRDKLIEMTPLSSLLSDWYIDDTIRLGAPYDIGNIVSTDYFFSTKNC
jgi:hypothetical protein